MLFFDLPMETKEDLRVYHQLRKHLKCEDYKQMQESVYFKQIRNIRCADTNINPIRKLTNKECNIWAVVMTYKQFESMILIQGEKPALDKSDVLIL